MKVVVCESWLIVHSVEREARADERLSCIHLVRHPL